jgi:hypothetical protein
MKSVHRALALVALTALVPASRVAAFAEDAPPAAAAATEDPVAAARKALDAYDRRARGAMTNTIPTEQAILRCAEAGKAAALREFLGHERFGALCFVLVCEAGAAEAESELLERLAVDTFLDRPGSALAIAGLRTEKVRAALRALAANEEVRTGEVSGAEVRAALVRAGDAAAIAELRTALASKDAGTAADALLAAGAARDATFLAEIAKLAADTRALSAPRVSRWNEEKRIESGGMTSITSSPFPLATVGDVAVEAANRIHASALPGFVAWWYELEKGPRFGRGADALKLLATYVAEDAEARNAKARGAGEAVALVIRSLRKPGAEMTSFVLTGVAFDKVWTVTYRLGGPDDATDGAAIVDAAGNVSAK